MRSVSCLLLLFLSLPCYQHTGTHPSHLAAALRSSEFDWLLGDWQRLNDRPGRSTFEHWTKISDSEYQGLSYTLRNEDTIFKEHMKLLWDKSRWIYDVRGGNEAPVLFIVIDQDSESFTCENQQNEFPRFIEYSLVDQRLVVKISGAGQEITFSFIKQ